MGKKKYRRQWQQNEHSKTKTEKKTQKKCAIDRYTQHKGIGKGYNGVTMFSKLNIWLKYFVVVHAACVSVRVCGAHCASRLLLQLEYVEVVKLINEKNNSTLTNENRRRRTSEHIDVTQTHTNASNHAHALTIPTNYFLRSITVKHNDIALGINSISPISWSRHEFVGKLFEW